MLLGVTTMLLGVTTMLLGVTTMLLGVTTMLLGVTTMLLGVTDTATRGYGSQRSRPCALRARLIAASSTVPSTIAVMCPILRRATAWCLP